MTEVQIRAHLSTLEAAQAAEAKFRAFGRDVLLADRDDALEVLDRINPRLAACKRAVHVLSGDFSEIEQAVAIDLLVESLVRGQPIDRQPLGDFLAEVRREAKLKRTSAKQKLLAERAAAQLRAAGQEPCHACGGRGKLEHFRHIDDGECFECRGTGVAHG